MNPFEQFRQPANPFLQFAPQRQQQPQERLIANIGEGRVVERSDGTRAFVSPGMSTTDPDTIARLMEGATPADASRGTQQEQYIQDNPILSRAATAASGVPFIGSYMDEAVGMVSPGGRDEMRFAQEAMQETRPGQSAALQVGTGIAAAIPMATAAIGTRVGQGVAGIAQRLLGQSAIRRTAGATAIGAATGATEGGIYGYGAGDDGDRAQSAGAGATFGGLIGGGVGAILPGMGSGIRAVAERLRNTPERAAASALGVSPGIARAARTLIGEVPEDVARANIQRGGQSAMLSDAGPSTQRMLDTALQQPGPGQQLGAGRIEARAGQATQNINQALDSTMGAPQGRLGAQDAIRDAARPQVNQAYQSAYSTPIDYSSDAGRRIEDLLGRLPGNKAQRAIAEASERMAYDGVPNAQIMANIGDNGRVTFQEMPNVMQLDYLKRHFDQIARDGTDPITQRMSSDAAFAARIARDIREAVGEAVPVYREALSTAADSIGEQAAVDFGATMLRPQVTREVARRRIADMTEAELRSARLGARQQIDDALANVRAVPSDQNIDARQASQAMRDLSSPSARAKLRDLLGDEAETLFRELDEAGQALGLRAATATNSRTAGRQADAEMFETMTEGSGAARALTRPIATGRDMAEELMGIGPRVTAERRAQLYGEMADLLTRSGGPEAERALRILQDANLGQPLAEAEARLVAGAVQQVIGSGGYLGLQQTTGTR